MSESWIAAFEDHMREVAERAEIPGVAVAVAQRGETVYEGGFGFRDAERGLPATPDTVFGIGSVTKSMTALATMRLADEGRLSPDDPVVKWLPEFRLPRDADVSGITIHHLLTHSMGLPPEPSLLHARAPSMRRDPDLYDIAGMVLPDDFATMPTVSTYGELLALIAGQDFDLLGPPGRWFSYSNEGYALLHGVVERASGVAFMDYLRDRVFSPLGMTRTGTQAEALAGYPNVTQLYVRRREGEREVVFASPAWHDIERIYGNGGLASTVQDLIRYLEVYRTGSHDGVGVSSSAVARMTAPHVDVPTGGSYGYGLHVHPDYHGVRVVGHGGGNKGIAAHVLVAPGPGITVAVLTNLSAAPAQKVAFGALNALLGLPLATLPVEFPDYPFDPERFAPYLGTYAAERQTLRLFRDGSEPRAAIQDKVLPARQYAADAVVAGEMPIRFLRDDAGRVWAASMGLRVLRRVMV